REHATLTLRHAQLLLATDPSAAVDVLATYHGDDPNRASQLRAEARARGVARIRAVPHTGNVLWAEGMPDGAIVSLGVDGTLMRTLPDQTSTKIAADAIRLSPYAYARSRHLLAYACDATALCIRDLVNGGLLAVPPALRGIGVVGVAFSPDGNRLAVLSRGGALRVLDAATAWSTRLEVGTDAGTTVTFVDDETIAVGIDAGIQVIGMSGQRQTLAVPGADVWDTHASRHQIVLGTSGGHGLLVELAPLRIASRVTLCPGAVSGVRFVPELRAIAYTCREGTLGTWDLQTGAATPRTLLQGHADLLRVAGDYVVAAGGGGSLVVLDRQTDLVTTYKGHGLRLITTAAPSPEFPFFLSADVRGGLRAWPLPARVARVLGDVHTNFLSAFFNERTNAVVATTHKATLTVFSAAGGVRAIAPHVPEALRIASSRERFATYGYSDVVELWSAAEMTLTRTLVTRHGSVSHVELATDTDDVITAGQDGRLVRWVAGAPTLVARFDQPITTFALGATRSPVVATDDGALWRITDDGR
ncbi:MAG: hypothetical protein H7138_11700, partial [Myxococcales bacterium]|nr:hypothetical protein [Myxococcales bacterium]